MAACEATHVSAGSYILLDFKGNMRGKIKHWREARKSIAHVRESKQGIFQIVAVHVG